MRQTKHLLWIFLLVIVAGCKKEKVENTEQEKPQTDLLKIYAWEPPYNITEDDAPSVVVSQLQSAINYAASQKKQLILEKGTYTINAQITIPSNSDIDFCGSEFVRQSSTTNIFTMFRNNDYTNGNDSIKISNLIINGNRVVDNLNADSATHRFSGLLLYKVSNSKLYRITVTQTINGEVQGSQVASGILFTNGCDNIDCYELNAYNNDRTGILIYQSSSVRIYGSLTYNNVGSGISSGFAPKCEYNNIVSHDNGYSNISVNGSQSKVNGVVTYNSGYSGLNIGHPAQTTPVSVSVDSSDYTIVDNVESYHNFYEGITISSSDHVILSNLNIYNNKRNNIKIYESSSGIQIQNADIHGYYSNSVNNGGQGIFIDGGSGHNLDNINSYDNYGNGIFITGTIGPV